MKHAGLLLALVAVAVPSSAAEKAPTGDASWQSKAMAEIAAAEYRFSWSEGDLSAPNRTHGLRTRVRRDGFSLVSRTSGTVQPGPAGDGIIVIAELIGLDKKDFLPLASNPAFQINRLTFSSNTTARF